ncbi:hypothetical protein CHU92_14250 [Flavobacterium cyanobacteriorum]|uniref:DUF2231 domain-containing protein n=1 Tax=Flavobacterium cyanobacteriorum TaxID=2022802 RepID=A0A255YUB3_9FLAO|nr:hypothetical protein [Flavobacterium cyanobacteriorum]OYQ32245.1 hypothetical protein CHU92_14250 [Flavobacterium cyanobacteriorum]
MNDAHFHLIVNHLPIIIPAIGLAVLVGGLVTRTEVIKRTAYCILIAGSLATIAAMASGEGAEEVVEQLPTVGHNLIEAHEDAAGTFAVLSYLLGLLSAVSLWASMRQQKISRILAPATVCYNMGVVYFALLTGSTGGKINHPEISNASSKITNVIEQEHTNDD